jgi:tyrosyl-tRNA synthetase
MKSIDEQLQWLAHGTEQIVTREELKQKLERAKASGKPLRVKLGCDPTAPDLHLGHGVVLRKLRQFQDLGHKAVLIIGDYTALIGDPTGQNKTRPMLDAAAIDRNATTYFEQAGKILDTSPAKLEIRRNSEWLSKMSFADVIRLASKMTVARMLERDTFEKRYKAGEPISTHEFLYPLMQGHDSVMIQSDIELGGTDQTFNNLVGRDLQREDGQEPQVVIIMPILEGLDGVEKMSKSKGNYIGLTDAPKDMFGKTMSISDDLMWRWYRLLLAKTDADIAALRAGHPMDAKKALARALVAQYHGDDAATQALAEFEAQFSKRDLAEVAEPFPCSAQPISLLDLVEAGQKVVSGKAASRGDIRRLIQQGGVQLDGQKVTDPQGSITPQPGQILKIGKRIVLKIQAG